jgi:pilus assembly protein Flp/PilA
MRTKCNKKRVELDPGMGTEPSALESVGRSPRSSLRRFLRDEAAPSAIEYALLVAGVGVIIIAVVYMLGTNARSSFDRASPNVPANSSSANP